MNAQPGLRIHLGGIALLAGTNSVNVSLDDVVQQSGVLSGTAPADATDNHTNVGGYFDFEIHGLNEPGQSALIVIPQFAPIPDGAVYRIYNLNTGWADFAVDSKNQLSSALGADGVCPAPGDAGYSPGLTQGHHCVQMLIEDGGVNDGDGRRNGVISDPGGVARLNVTDPNVVPATDTASKSGGGGSFGLFFLLLMPGLRLLKVLLRRNYRFSLDKASKARFATAVE
jgi:hypothetical protein